MRVVVQLPVYAYRFMIGKQNKMNYDIEINSRESLDDIFDSRSNYRYVQLTHTTTAIFSILEDIYIFFIDFGTSQVTQRCIYKSKFNIC